MFDLGMAIAALIIFVLGIGYLIAEKLMDKKNKDLKEKLHKNIFFYICLLVCGFSTSCYLIAFGIPIYIILIPIIAIILAKVFEKKKILKILFTLIMFILLILIGMYCYYKTTYNNQFLQYFQYINGIRSMGKETSDVKDLINSALENNKKNSSKKVTVKCILKDADYNKERQEKSYTTVEELEWLLNNINIEEASIDFEYDKNNHFIECIEIFVPIAEDLEEEKFWEYIRGFNNDDIKLEYIKDFFVKARQKLDEINKEKENKIIALKGKPIKIVYVVNNRDELEVNSLDELEVNKVLEKLNEKENYRLLIQTYNEYYKISVMYYTR